MGTSNLSVKMSVVKRDGRERTVTNKLVMSTSTTLIDFETAEFNATVPDMNFGHLC